MAESGSRRIPAPIKTLTLAVLALGLVALAVGKAPARGGYAKYQCDMAKNQIAGAKDAANNNKIAAYSKLNEANKAAAEAEDAHKGKVIGEGGWTQEKESAYQSSMASGNQNLSTGVSHRNAGIWRYDQGTAKNTAGDNFYTAQNYTAAYPEYTKATEPIGALQHFNYATSDYDQERQCNNAALTWFLYAKQMCQ